jgi:glycosyltransferase involved in cell wall biosynthesis
MRVLFATTHTYLPQRTGGSESMTHDLCLALESRGVGVGVLAALDPRGFVGFRNRLRRRIRPARRFPSDNVMGYPVYRGWRPAEGVREVIGDFAPTIAFVQAGAPMLLVNAFLEHGLPTVFYVNDVGFDALGGRPAPHPLLLCIANSQFTASRFAKEFGIEPRVIPPFVNLERYRVATSRQKVVFIGLVPKKGVELAFRLAGSRPDVPFEFVESWPLGRRDFREFKRRGAALGNVTVRRSVADIRAVYGLAKLLLVPSVCEEAWGRVSTEAQCSGVPVLASDRGGLPESVGPGGLLIDIEAPLAEWSAALSVMWDDDAAYRRLSDAALVHSQRRELQFDFLVDELLGLLRNHARKA